MKTEQGGGKKEVLKNVLLISVTLFIVLIALYVPPAYGVFAFAAALAVAAYIKLGKKKKEAQQ